MSLITMPNYPAPKSVEFTSHDTVAVSTSPFTGQQQIMDWQASWLEASITMPPLTHAQAQQWIGFLLACRGPVNTFLFGDPAAARPQGTGVGSPKTRGVAYGYRITTTGWGSNQIVLKAGDWLQIGNRLYRCTTPTVFADPIGNCDFDIWPQIREQVPSGSAINLVYPKGLFRLASATQKWSINDALIYGLQFTIREALDATAV